MSTEFVWLVSVASTVASLRKAQNCGGHKIGGSGSIGNHEIRDGLLLLKSCTF